MRPAEIARMSTIDLIRRLVNDFSGLVDKEVELGKAELREDLSTTLTSAILLVSAGVLLLIGLICLIVAGILALSFVMPGWLAAVVVAVFFLVVGAILGLIGRSKLKITPLKRTRETLSEDMQWVRGQLGR